MHQSGHTRRRRIGHTLMELVVAMVASTFLLAGLGSVMMIGRQVAYTPSAANHRVDTADVVNQIAEELRYATLVIQQTPQVLEFVVADRNGDGTAEKIRYEWSGTLGAPLSRKLNAETATMVLDSVHAFSTSLQSKPKTAPLKTTIDSAETMLLSNATVQAGLDRDITATFHLAQQINPSVFPSVPANALYWNATKVDFYGRKSGAVEESFIFQLRPTGSPNDGPTSQALANLTISEATITASYGWNTIVFPSPVRELNFHRRYAVVWSQAVAGSGCRLLVNDSAASGVLESSDGGASWQYVTTRQMYGRLYGTYTTPGPTYNVTRNFVSHVQLSVQSGEQSHARIDASIPLSNTPELLSGFWRADFDADPTSINANGDADPDWALAAGSFDAANLINGIWYASGALRTRPPNDFTNTTIVEVRCRNSTVGGNGAVMRINADRQSGLYAPLLVYVRRQSDGSQTLTLLGKPSDAATTTLCSRQSLSSEFIRFRLTIVPQHDVVNLQINDEDQGTFRYPTYAPSSSSDRFLTLFADTSLAEFDYVDVRIAN